MAQFKNSVKIGSTASETTFDLSKPITDFRFLLVYGYLNASGADSKRIIDSGIIPVAEIIQEGIITTYVANGDNSRRITAIFNSSTPSKCTTTGRNSLNFGVYGIP